MTGSKKTIAQFCRMHGVAQSAVVKAARKVLPVPQRRLRDPTYLLDPAEQRLLRDELGLPDRPTAPPPDAPPIEAEPEPAPRMRSDPLPPPGSLRFGPGVRAVRVHPAAIDAVDRSPRFRKRLSLSMQQLAAHGRTAMVKGCADPANRGWLRTAFGGNGGMQYYLWWARQGSPPVEHLGGRAGDVFVRAVRHHDDHSPLVAGGLDDYVGFGPDDVEDEGYVTRPWTAEQMRFVEASDPVRFVLGRPGSGKTTVLWKAVEARADQRVLYLTWSRALTQVAGERFAAFAPIGVEVQALDVVSLLGELIGDDVTRMPLAESQRRFESRVPGAALGGWRGYTGGLYAEVRAMVIGRAVPGAPGAGIEHGLARLDAEAYIGLRAGEVGRSMARAAADALAALDADARAEAFPELVAATEAIERLRADRLPPGFDRFDRIVVDEVQDLTLLDAAVIVELCRAIGRARGFAPWLLMAGDDGQTVRPSGFDWGRLADLVAEGLAPPRKFQLEENLRCPARIAEVVQRASAVYRTLEKGRRPTKQSREAGGQHAEAFLYHVDASTVAEAIALVEQLDEVDEAVLLAPQAERPAWLPPHLRDAVRTPAEVKGLEYQSVVVLDPGRFMVGTRPEARALDHGPSEHDLRTRIDQFRVALSRATETLAFVDVRPDDDARRMSLDLLDRPVPCDPQDLVEHFADGDVAPEDRVRRRMDEARALIDEVPRRAWRRATQAVRLLGDPGLPNGVASAEVRRAAHDTLLATAARLRVEGLPERVRQADVDDAVGATLTALGSDCHDEAVDALNAWCAATDGSPVALLDGLLELGSEGEWLRQALVPAHQRLRQQIAALADTPAGAAHLVAEVEAWLPRVGFAGDAEAEARALRCRGAHTLLKAGDLARAEALAEHIRPPDLWISARLLEAQARFVDAAMVFEQAGAAADALRCWRRAGDWQRAKAVLEADPGIAQASHAAADLGWLIELEALIGRRPAGLSERLTPAEGQRLAALIGSPDPGP